MAPGSLRDLAATSWLTGRWSPDSGGASRGGVAASLFGAKVGEGRAASASDLTSGLGTALVRDEVSVLICGLVRDPKGSTDAVGDAD
jgi:hypothetical protein